MPENEDQTLNANPPEKKPLNPEMEVVSMNQPKPQVSSTETTPQTEVASEIEMKVKPTQTPPPIAKNTGAVSSGEVKLPPKKIGKEQTAASRKRFLLGCFGAFIFLFVVFIVLMVLMISRTGASNPIMRSLGLDPGGIKSFLQGVVGFTFGLFSLLFLVLAVIALFRFLGAQKTDKEKRGHNAKVSLLSTVAMIVLIFIWVFLSGYISRIVIIPESVIAEIVVVQPSDLENLEAPVEIRFSAGNVARSLLNSGLTIEAMNWDLDGDGEFETPVRDEEITRLYDQRGTYNVGLQVKILGEEDFREPYVKTIFIGDALFEATPSSGIPPLEVQFDASRIITEGNVGSLDWDFDGDGQFDLEGPDNLRPRYTFTQIGNYQVLLRVVDKNGTLNRYTRTIEVTPTDQPLVSARIDASPGVTGTAPFQVRLDASQSSSLKGNVIKYQWDFGDGSQLQSGQSVTHLYNAPGFYSVTLEVEDDLGNVGETVLEIEVKGAASAPEAVIKTNPEADAETETVTGKLPFKVAFDASDSLDIDGDIIEFEWDFNDDGVTDAEGEKTEHTFEQIGEFEVVLTVTDAQGQSSSSDVRVVVEEPGVQAIIQATPEEGSAPLVVDFDGSASSTFNGNIVSYEWDFGDGSPKTVTGATVSHRYNAVGSYQVTLRVVTNTNESGVTTRTINVREVPLKACFNSSRLSGPAPLTVSFNSSCSTGKISDYNWQYGDGTESTSGNPTHTFEFPGTYTVRLEVVDDKNNVSTYEEVIEAQ